VGFLAQPVLMFRTISKALSSALLAVLLLLGPPLVLLRFVGNPLPTTVPTVDDVSFAIRTGQIDSWTWIKALSIVGWLAWAHLAGSFIVEVASAVRGGKARAIRGLGATQWFASRLVAQFTLATSVLVQSTAAMASTAALPPLSSAAVITMADVDVNADSTVATVSELEPVAGEVAGREASDSVEGADVLVGRRDTLWGLAENHLGDGEQWEVIRDANVGRRMPDGTVLDGDFTRVERGWRLVVPGKSTVDADPGVGASSSQPSAVTIEKGDNLWRLSEERLTSAEGPPHVAEVLDYVNQVVERNDDAIDNPDLIFPGQVFTLPGVGSQAGTAVPAATESSALTGGTGVAGAAGDQVTAAGPSGATAEGVAHVPVPGESPSTQQSTVQQEPIRTIGTLSVGVAGGLLGAGALGLLRRRRSYRMANRPPGTVPAPPPPEFDPLERALHRQGDEQTLRWLHAALGSLTARPVWEGEQVAQPVMARLGSDDLEVVFDVADAMAAPLPWVRPDDGIHWQLSRSIEAEELPEGRSHGPLPTLVTLGVDRLANLEGLGLLSVVGPGTAPMDLIRSIVHELATSIGIGTVDVRSTMPIAGTETYGLVQVQSPSAMVAELVPWLNDVAEGLVEGESSNAFAHRLTSEEPLGPVVVVTDEVALRGLEELVALAERRQLPLAILVAGSAAADHTIEVTPESATMQPWGETFEPQQLSEEVAQMLGELLVDALEGADEPLVVGVELSASVSGLRERTGLAGQRGPRPAPATTYRPPARRRSGDEGQRQGEQEVVAVADGREGADDGRGVDFAVGPVPELELNLESMSEREFELDPGIELEPESDLADGLDSSDDVTISVLGHVEAEGLPDLTSQQLSLLTYLACNGPTTRELLIEGLWDGQVISQSRFPNMLAETRARIGRNHLPEARDGRYEVRGITTDLAAFEHGVRVAQGQDDAQAALTLRSILELVRGMPLTPPGGRFWSWVGDQSHFGARVEAMVADTAATLARIERDRGSPEGAIWACERGLKASPTDQTLVTTLTDVYMAQGKPGLAHRLVDGWEDKVSRMDCGEPSDEPRKRLAI